MTKSLKKKSQMVVALREARDKASEADKTHPAQGPQIGVAGGEWEEREREEENVKERRRGIRGWWGRKRKEKRKKNEEVWHVGGGKKIKK